MTSKKIKKKFLCITAVLFLAAALILPAQFFGRGIRAAADSSRYVLFDACNNAWGGITTVNRTDYKYGSGCVEFSSDGESGSTSVTLAETVFTSSATSLTAQNAEFCFWFYIDDLNSVTNYAGGDKYFAVELGSDEKCDVDEYEWNLFNYENQMVSGGWSLLRLPLSAAAKHGEPQISGLKRIRFLSRGEQRTMRIDCLYMCETGYTGELLDPINYKEILTTPSDFDGAVADSQTAHESVSAKKSGADIVFEAQGAASGTTHLRQSNFGVSLWLRSSDPSAVITLTLVLGDGGSRELSFTKTITIQNGFNFILFDSIKSVAAGFDYDDIDTFSLSLNNNVAVTANLEKIRIINLDLESNSYPYGFAADESSRTFMVDNSIAKGKKDVIIGLGIAGICVFGSVFLAFGTIIAGSFIKSKIKK